MANLVCVVASFLLGGIPFGLLLGKLKGVDIRAIGSGNIGATNLTRAAGRPWGIAAFVLDFGKGLLPVVGSPVLARWLQDSLGAFGTPDGAAPTAAPESWAPVYVQIACGLAAILGHVFPVYLKFRGGKGVATSFGVMAGLLPFAALAAAASWAVVFLFSRVVSAASVAAAVVFPAATFLIYRTRVTEGFLALMGLSIVVAALIVVRHRGNIQRLLSRKEHRFR